jgi:hypothetical protein
MSSVPPQGPGATPPPPPPPYPPNVPPPDAGGLPWETQAIGPESFFETAKLFVTAPEQAWRLTRETGDYMRPLLFGIIVGWVGAIFNAVWSAIFGANILRMIVRMIPGEHPELGMMGSGGGFFFNIIFAPIGIALGLFIGAAILHVSFMIVGALKASRSQFEGSFRLCAYASIANIANVIPFVGGLVAGIWAIYLMVVGAQQLHKTTQNKALMGILLPLLLCCVCAAVAVALATVLGVAATRGVIGR